MCCTCIAIMTFYSDSGAALFETCDEAAIFLSCCVQVCGSKRTVQAAHLIDRSLIEEAKSVGLDVYDPRNGIALCKPCHSHFSKSSLWAFEVTPRDGHFPVQLTVVVSDSLKECPDFSGKWFVSECSCGFSHVAAYFTFCSLAVQDCVLVCFSICLVLFTVATG
jgi:hypothetical protein